MSTRSPIAASAVPRLIAVVVLPTPPFWLAITRMRGGAAGAGLGGGRGGVGHGRAFEALRTRRIAAFGSSLLATKSIARSGAAERVSSCALAERPRGKTPTAPWVDPRSGEFDEARQGGEGARGRRRPQARALRGRWIRFGRGGFRPARRSRGRLRAGTRICAGRFRCSGRARRGRRRAGSRSPSRESRRRSPCRPNAGRRGASARAGRCRRCGGSTLRRNWPRR